MTSQSVGMGDNCNGMRQKGSGQPRQIESHSWRTLIIGGWGWFGIEALETT
jgi:hypothetical protein